MYSKAPDPRAAMAQVLTGADRRYAGATAPAAGLFLWRVEYPPDLRYPGVACPNWFKLTAMSWFERIVPSRIKTERRTRSVPEGLWTKCPACDAVLYKAEIERNLYVCPKCSHHMRINGRERFMKFLDTGSTTEIAAKVEPEDPLKFKDSKRYKDRLVQAQKQTGERDALIVHGWKTGGAGRGGLRVRVSVSGRFHGLGGRREVRAGG